MQNVENDKKEKINYRSIHWKEWKFMTQNPSNEHET